MNTEQITMKTTKDVLEMVREIAEETGEKHYGVLRRVLRQELTRIRMIPKAMQYLGLIAASTGEEPGVVLERILHKELEKVGRQAQPTRRGKE